MSQSLFTLVGYITWMLLLLATLGMYRSYISLTGQRAPNKFSPDGSDVSPFSGRLCRAHANCYEFFPIAGGFLLAAIASGNTSITDPLAIYLLGARILQSSIHLLSTSILAVYCRFAFFLVQVGIAVVWAVKFLS